jgi:hypothetical protein
MSFLKLFTGVKMSSVEFDKLKNKVAVAAATIAHQNTVIADLNARLAAATAPVVTPVEVSDADYAALGKVLEDVFANTPLLAPIADTIAAPTAQVDAAIAGLPAVAPASTLVDVGGLVHPALS